MPNWCKGVLKIRGKKENLINLIQNEIERYGFPSTPDSYTKYPLDLKIDEYGDIFVDHTDNEHHSWLYFKDSRRLFVEENIEWFFSNDEEEEIQALDIKQAWNLESEYFAELSKKYNVDFRMTGFECGCCFIQEIEVIKGKITIDNATQPENYSWIAYDPRLGG